MRSELLWSQEKALSWVVKYVSYVINLTSFRILATRKMRKIFTTRITLASLFVEAVLFPFDVQTCDARWTSQDNKKCRQWSWLLARATTAQGAKPGRSAHPWRTREYSWRSRTRSLRLMRYFSWTSRGYRPCTSCPQRCSRGGIGWRPRPIG